MSFDVETVPPMPYELWHALEQIRKDYGKICDITGKAKTLLKFGRNESLGTTLETIWQYGGDETYIATNAIDTISSSDNANTQEVVIEGHTVDGNGDFTFVTQTVTLTGTTKATLGTPLARCNRAYNNNGTTLAASSTIYIYEDDDTATPGVPDTASKVHLTMNAGPEQSEKAATTISKDDFFIVHQFLGSVNKKAAATVDFEFQLRLKGKIFRTVLIGSANSAAGPTEIQLEPPFVVPSNADIRIRARSSSSGADVTAWMNGYLARVDRDA